jgi:hypothetical protein
MITIGDNKTKNGAQQVILILFRHMNSASNRSSFFLSLDLKACHLRCERWGRRTNLTKGRDLGLVELDAGARHQQPDPERDAEVRLGSDGVDGVGGRQGAVRQRERAVDAAGHEAG